MPELIFYVVGGYLKIDSKVYMQEMLNEDSCLSKILKWRGVVSEPDENGIVTVNFNYNFEIELGESDIYILSMLKEKYGDRVKGRICFRWLAGDSMSNFTIDLDSNDEKILQQQ